MNSTGLTIAGAGSGTSMLAQVLVWATSWPLKPLNFDEAMAVSGLVMGGIGLLTHFLINKNKAGAATPSNPT